MDSRIILTKADFSANNIGRYVEISELTKKVLAKQTQYDESSAEAAALNTFLAGLTSGGFIGGDNPLLNTLIIPALASGHDELLYDIARLDSDGYPTNLMAADEKTAEVKAFTVGVDSNGRVVAINRQNSVQPATDLSYITIDLFTSNTVYPSFSVMTYRNNTMIPASASAVYIGNTTSGCKFRFMKNDIRLAVGSSVAMKREISYGNNGSRGFNGISYNASDIDFELLSDGITLGERTYNSEISTVPGYISQVNTFDIGTFAYTNMVHESMIAIGSYLSSAKMAEFKALVDTLMTNLHVKTW